MSENVIKTSTTSEVARERNRAAADRTLAVDNNTYFEKYKESIVT
jgi:hypothetical protein